MRVITFRHQIRSIRKDEFTWKEDHNYTQIQREMKIYEYKIGELILFTFRK